MFSELSSLEIVGVISLVLYVILAVRENPWCWPASIVGVTCYIIVMYQKQVYLEVGLNFYYLAISMFGIWYWMRGGREGKSLAISLTPQTEWIVLGVVAVVTTIGLGLLIDNLPEVLGLVPTDVAWIDSITTVLSLVATYLLVRKRLENWLVWIVADAIYIPLMIYKEAYFFAGLYGFFLVACIFGIITWRKHMEVQLT